MSSGVVVKSAILFCVRGGARGDCFAVVAVPAAQSFAGSQSQDKWGGANGLSAVQIYPRRCCGVARGDRLCAQGAIDANSPRQTLKAGAALGDC